LIRITVKNLQKRIPFTRAISRKIKQAVRRCFLSEKVKKPAEINLCLVTGRKIRMMNLKYFGKSAPTDVIAFDLGNRKDFIFADIIICADTAVSNARIYKKSPLQELYLYAIHGALHILGYRDKTKKDRLIMRKKEKSIEYTIDKICPYKKPKH